MKKMNKGLLIAISFIFAIALGSGAFCADTPTTASKETKEERDKRMGWWRDARFGMFIHWGLYSVPAGEWNGKTTTGAGEWMMNDMKISVANYEPIAKQFNPVKFNAAEWVKTAKDAGMKYMVITSKHHEGFAMFDTKTTDYNIVKATPFKRDPMKELAAECAKQGIVFCFYHSILDWHNLDYLPRREADKRPAEGADYNRYIDYMKSQLGELLTNYGKIGVLWFDGGWNHTPQDHRAQEVVDYLHSLQPGIIINNRIQLPLDFDTPEQTIPATGLPGRDWETCMTMNDTWGFKKADNNWKSSEDLIRKLADIASKGGNFLLNVGPTGEGEIPQPSIERLAAMGAWMKVNGESIYGTGPSPFKRLPWGRCTMKPGKLYLHVFDWPATGTLLVPGLKNETNGIYLLASPQAKIHQVLPAKKTDKGLEITLPASAPDKVDSVVVVEIKGTPDVPNVVTQVQPQADGKIILKAADADLTGGVQYEKDKDAIGYWINKDDSVAWQFSAKSKGKYEVAITYACPGGEEGSSFRVSVSAQGDAPKLRGTTKSTGGWATFTTEKLGEISVDSEKDNLLSVNARKIAHGAAMNLRSITLTPVK